MKNRPNRPYYVACSPSGYHVFKRGRKYAILCDLTLEEANRWLKKLNAGQKVQHDSR
jgi:hypothetical protein